MKFFTMAIFLVLVGFSADLIGQTQVTLTSVKDNTLYQNSGGTFSNGAGIYCFAGRVGSGGGGNLRRALIAFDLSQIPQNAVIESAVLTMTMSKTISGANNVAIHRVTADWGEGTSDASGEEGTGGISATGDATWIHNFFDTSNWTNEGGDFQALQSAMTSVSGPGAYTWGSTEDMVADVQSWVNNTEQNFGWILRGNESTVGSTKRFNTHENSNSGSRPQLVITYTVGATSVSEKDVILPEVVTLAQNYPNPFNPTTQIHYTIPGIKNFTEVKLEVFNLIGQKIQTLVQANQAPGSYSVKWDGKSFDGNIVSNGVYIYRLSVGDQIEMKKMTFLK